MERICQDCGKEFEGRADAQFCSDACRIRTRRKQKSVASDTVSLSEKEGIPDGMELIDKAELARLRALAAQAELGPEIQIDYAKLISYLSDAKQYIRKHYPEVFARDPTDIDGMLDRIFGPNHKGKIPSMRFTVNVNLAKSALTPD
jgi:hypothetical protein